MNRPPARSPVSFDWPDADQIDRGEQAGYSVFARARGITAPTLIGVNTRLGAAIELNTAIGFQILRFGGSAEYNMNSRAILQCHGRGKVVAALDTRDAEERLVPQSVGMSVELGVLEIVVGDQFAIDTLRDVNGIAFLPPACGNSCLAPRPPRCRSPRRRVSARERRFAWPQGARAARGSVRRTAVVPCYCYE
jgi:hypothetical protein